MRSTSPNRKYTLLCFGRRLGQLLDEHPSPQRAIAKTAGISPGALTDYRQGRILPGSEETLRDLADALASEGDDAEALHEELSGLAWVDYWDYQVRCVDQLPSEVRGYLDEAERRRGS